MTHADLTGNKIKARQLCLVRGAFNLDHDQLYFWVS